MQVFWHDECQTHDTGRGLFDTAPSPLLARQTVHPENAQRMANVRRALEKGPVAEHLTWRKGRMVTDDEILTLHTPEHLENLKMLAREGGRRLGGHTVFAEGSLKPIRAAAGTALAAIDAIIDGKTKMAYALVRPPGHHAQLSRIDGYCFLNNTALAAERAIRRGAAKRIAIIDWDVHHGNGTQDCFYARDDVLTISLHMNHGSWGKFHPQTGYTDERGEGRGLGFNVNIAMPFGLGDVAYIEAFEKIVIPRVDAFKPDLIVIANGQDACQFDPNGRQCVTTDGFYRMGVMARDLALRHAGGRLLSVQEGGYSEAYIPLCAHASVEGLLGLPQQTPDPLGRYPEDVEDSRAVIAAIAEDLGQP